MKRLDKIKLAIERGVTCNPETGKMYGISGREIKRISKGYITMSIINGDEKINIPAHQFIYYVATGKTVDIIDHINKDTMDNRICNLREVS